MFVTRRPVVVIVLTLVVTVVLGGFASQSVFDDGAAVDNELSDALELVEDRFGGRSSLLQVVVESTDGADVRSAAALQAVTALQERLADDPVGDTLLDDGGAQPPVISFLGGAEAAIAESGASVDELDDEEVRDLQDRGVEVLPDEVGAQLEDLLGEGEPPTVGLVLIFQDTEDLDEEGGLEVQRQLATFVDEVPTPPGIALSPLSFALLTEDSDSGSEIARLFGTALGLILLVLFAVYWVKPGEGQRLAVVRRSAVDVGLTLLVILFAVVWMQGIGALLGPGFADLIGPFDSQTQVVPILIVGLGVDFSIHLLARYRSEAGTSGDPAGSFHRAFATVGLALLLDTTATAIGFLTNLVSPVVFLRTLGVLAAVGIVAAFVMTVTFLPAVRLLLDRRAATRDRLPVDALAQTNESALPRLMGGASVVAERAPWAVLAATVALTAAGAYGFTQLGSRFELIDFVPQDDPQLATFQTLEEEFGGSFDEATDVLLTGDVATPEAHDTLVAVLEDATEVEGIGTVGDRVDGTSVVSVLATLFDGGGDGGPPGGGDGGPPEGNEEGGPPEGNGEGGPPEGNGEGGPPAGEAEDGPPEAAQPFLELGLEPDLTVADDADVEELYRTLLDEVDQAEEVLLEEDGTWYGRVQLRTNVDQDESEALRIELEEVFAPLQDAGVEVVVTSQQMVQASVSSEIEEAQLRSIVIALVAVMVLLALFFGWRRRQPMVGVLTVLPVGFVLAATFGMMAVTDIPLNPVTATLAALSIGIGVPFNIHVATRFLEERDEDPDGALRRAVSRTGGAVIASALTTGIGFGVLITATLLPFEQLGYVIVYAIVLSAVASTLVLPSMLRVWERRRDAATST